MVYGVQAEQHDVEILVKADGVLPDVGGDTNRLLQVLGNLVSNALRYTPTGGYITLGATQAKDTVVLSVHDTGRGIASDDLSHVFDRFYRGQGTGDPAENQTGLGLAIARSLVELHGGTITAESNPGQSSTFTIRLPIAR